ncbi:MAG: site-specific DNA-methyltransferase [Candidatus Thorarchaeota archaeon]|nr:MAG: site-specific DNA-methyltransferase [Candidatus Thorarchaeota archaeon]
MRDLPSDSIDLIVADPPFGIDFDGKSSMYNRDGTRVVEGYEEVLSSYDQFTSEWIGEIPRILKDTGSAYIFSGWNNLEDILRSARKAGLAMMNHIIWKYQFGVFTKRRFVTSHYHLILFTNDPKNYFFNKWENYPEDVWIINRDYRPGQSKNSTKLPLQVVQRCIDFSSQPGDLVLDPFMGNGTTAAAARGNWRHFIGFEINKQLREIIDQEVWSVKPGQFYIPYSDRLPSIEELGAMYPRAYKEYLRQRTKQDRAS